MEKKISFFDKMMMALTFAEANEHETARQVISKDQDAGSQKRPGCAEKSSQHSAACQAK